MAQAVSSLWDLVGNNSRIDAASLACAIEEAASQADDFRTCLLIRDSVEAIQSLWGKERAGKWLNSSPFGTLIQDICTSISNEAQGEHGFPSLKRRIVDATKPETILRFLRELSEDLHSPTRLIIGGSIALILSGHLLRKTDDVDVVDEVPEALRTRHQLLAELEDDYGLKLTHFQSHYLPEGWDGRIHSVGTFGALQVFAVDAYDIFMTKLFSVRRKDREDLRSLLSHLDRVMIEERLRTSTAAFKTEAKLWEAAEKNWYVLFGQKLPE